MKTTFSVICLFIVALVTIPLQAQTIKQQGIAYRYNGKNKRTPIGGVYLKAITSNNGVVSDEKTGAFTLVLNNLKMGSRIGNVRVTKQGMMIFNQQAVDEWSVRKEPLCLILCNADEFQKQKDNLIAIGRNEAKKKYEKRLTELHKQNDAKQLEIADYYNKLDSLDKEYQNALKHMDEYADVFARIDESEIDTIAQHAIEMFKRGEIEESIRLLEQQNYMEKIKQANRTIEQADELISTARTAKTLAEQDKKIYIERINTLMQNEGKDSDIYWKNLYSLSYNFVNEKKYESAYMCNEELLPLLKKFYERDTKAWKATYLEILVSSSFLANLLGKFEEGEQYSLYALKVDPTNHIAYSNLAAALLFKGNVDEAEKIYRQYKSELKDGCLDDFAEFERLEVIPKERKADVKRIKAMLKE